ncbi:TolB family protein [Clostridium formicaceticum]|uniref:Translocation protein TolB n=1 Tax=Clostridium formicaceticum TaxID=1497 RepID=A0AAC9RJR3_9CLOT|nr:hypothetical protein [Clostridium formicaceticum]AOY77780.1 hypothetical protein BJL90_19090 [Clostridium formicaceticum]ARE88386.1 translocation protein TolB [Clostridium formicaceticum]
MGIRTEKWLTKVAMIGLLGLVAIIAYQSFTKEVIETKEPVIVSTDMRSLENDEEDKPLQIVAKEEIDGIEGISEFMGAMGNNEVIARIGLGRAGIEELYNQYSKPFEKKEEVDFINRAKGPLFKINLTTLEKTPLKTDEVAFDPIEMSPILSPDGRKLMHIPYVWDESVEVIKPAIVYDLRNQSVTNIDANIDSDMAPEDVFYRGWSKDSKYIVGFGIEDEEQSIITFEVENNQFQKFKMDSDVFRINPLGHIFSEDGKEIFFVGWENETPGIYKLGVDSGNVELAMALPDEGEENFVRNYPYRIIDGGNRIVFLGNIRGKNGLYIYHDDRKSFTKIAEGGGASIPFSISPDNKKIIYATYFRNENSRRFWKIYAAKIVEDALENRILISEDVAEYPGMPIISWSGDSRSVVMYEPQIFTLDSRVFVERGIIRKIRFK